MSNKAEKRGLVPRLRFREFREAGEWGRQFGDALFDQISNKDHNSDLPVLAITQEQGAIPRNLIDYHVSVTEKSIESYKVVEIGDFIISLRSFQGGIEYSNYKGICSPAYVILRLKAGYSADYFKHLLKNSRFIALLTKNLEGLRDGKMVSYKQFSELQLPTPSPKEQQKIADCLASLDELITLETQKLDTLKTHKKGLMQQLFPAEGETLPKLRFPEFRIAGEWEVTTLGQTADFQSGGTPSKENPAFWNGSIPWVSAKDMKQLFLDDTEDHITTIAVEDGAKLVQAGTLLILTRGMTLLKDIPICILSRQMSFNQDVKALSVTGDVDERFLAYMLLGSKQRLLGLVDIAGHGTGRLDTDELKTFELMVPQAVEQQKIADCLSSLDDLITAQTQKLAAFKTHKKGLMQQLFPVLDEASA